MMTDSSNSNNFRVVCLMLFRFTSGLNIVEMEVLFKIQSSTIYCLTDCFDIEKNIEKNTAAISNFSKFLY